MSWLGELDEALRHRRVPPLERERLVLELSDHVACDPAGAEQLGSPEALASRYAEELAADGARQGAWVAFWALALTAVALAVSQLIAGRTGYPGFDNGRSLLLSIPAILGIFVAPQLALVAGSLAALRAWRRRHELTLPAAEVALIRRRARAGLLAGGAVAGGLALYLVNFSGVLPQWWSLTMLGVTLPAGLALLAAARVVRRTGVVVAALPGAAGGLEQDLPVLTRLSVVREHAAGAAAAVVLSGFAAVTAAGWYAEHSLVEGLERGVAELIFAAAGLAALRRVLGGIGQMGAAAAPDAG